MSIYIPGKIIILEKTYTVMFDDKLVLKSDCQGEIRYKEQIIKLQPNHDQDPRHHEQIEASFFHELTHGWLHAICEEELRDKEEFVSRLSTVIYHSLRESGMLQEGNL